MKMPWGKFKEIEIYKLPSSYLLWIAENVQENDPYNVKIVKEADEEWQHREKHNNHFEEWEG